MTVQQLLTEKEIENYLRKHDFFENHIPVHVINLHQVKESIEGYVNNIFLVKDSMGKSIVVKQVLSYIRKVKEDNGNHIPVLLKRLRNEVGVITYFNEIMPGICPEIYLFDEDNHLIVMEDLTDLRLLRFDFSEYVKQNDFGHIIGTFLAKLCYYSSELYLTPYEKKRQVDFFENNDRVLIGNMMINQNPLTSMDSNPFFGENSRLIHKDIVNNSSIQKRIQLLADEFFNNPFALTHNDLHTSNILTDSENVKIIDMEFSGYGPPSIDMGRLLGSLMLNYFSCYGLDNAESETVQDFQNFLIKSIRNLVLTFANTLKKLWYQDDAFEGQDKNIRFSVFIKKYLQDSLEMAALGMILRIPNQKLIISEDMARITDPVKRELVETKCLTCVKHIFENNYNCILKFTDYIKTI
jgi:5-methylthioribose kinase